MKNLLFIFLLAPLFSMAQSSFDEAEQLYNQENFRSAKPLFKEYLNAHPGHRKTREYLGDIAGYNEDWNTAIDYYKELAKEDKNNADYHFKYGGALGLKALSINKLRALTYIGDIKEQFEIAASLDKNHIEARWALVEFYIQLPGIVGGSETKALMYANQLRGISAVDGYLAIGYVAEYSDRPKDAEKYYKMAIEIGGSPHTYEKLADHYEKNNEPEKALETTSASLKIHKRNGLNYQIGKIVGQYNLDAEYGIRSLHAYLDNFSVRDGVPKDWAYLRLAQIYKNLGDKDDALLWVNKAIDSRSDFEEALAEKKLIDAL